MKIARFLDARFLSFLLSSIRKIAKGEVSDQPIYKYLLEVGSGCLSLKITGSKSGYREDKGMIKNYVIKEMSSDDPT